MFTGTLSLLCRFRGRLNRQASPSNHIGHGIIRAVHSLKSESMPWEKTLQLLQSTLDSPQQNSQKLSVDIQLYEPELREMFVKGGGKGGQKINKVRNCVLLKHLPTGIQVRCQQSRKLDENRKISRKRLIGKLQMFLQEANENHNAQVICKETQQIERIQKRKAKTQSRSAKKYGGGGGGTGPRQPTNAIDEYYMDDEEEDEWFDDEDEWDEDQDGYWWQEDDED